MEDMLEKWIWPQMDHVLHDAEIQQRVSITKVAKVYPVHLTLSRNDVTGVQVPVQTGSSRLQLIDVAQHACLDILRDGFVRGNHSPRTLGHSLP